MPAGNWKIMGLFGILSAVFAIWACDGARDADQTDDDQGGDSDSDGDGDGDSDGDGDDDNDDTNGDDDSDSNNDDDDDNDDNDNNDNNDNDNNDNNDNDDTEDTDGDCGNGQLDNGEVCDGDHVPCETLNPDWVDGDALCLGDCTGYDESTCEKNIDINEDEMAGMIQKAAAITGIAQMSIFGMDWIGKIEQDIKNHIDGVFADNGADAELAFDHIVASGPNALDLHYAGGDREILDGDLVEVDIGAKYKGWCGDLTRTFPANGKFTDRQKELYQLLVDVEKAAGEFMEFGKTLSDATAFAQEMFRASPLTALDANGNEATMDNFFLHGLSHFIGQEVHGGDLDVGMSDPPPVGYVFSNEPGLYIESEGIGMRLEDDYVMTEDGAVNIWKNTIRTVEDIENFMAKAQKGEPFDFKMEINEDAIEALKAGGYTAHMDF